MAHTHGGVTPLLSNGSLPVRGGSWKEILPAPRSGKRAAFESRRCAGRRGGGTMSKDDDLTIELRAGRKETMKPRTAILFLLALCFVVALQAQAPSALQFSPPDPVPAQVNASIALTAYKAYLEDHLNQVIAPAIDGANQKEAADFAALKTQQDLDRTAFAAGLARDATSLQSCPSGQNCSFTISACDISGVFGADPNILHGPTQPSADPTFTCKAGWMQPGERLYYTQYSPLAGLYTISASVASVPVPSCPAGTTGIGFHLEIAGVRFPADGSSIPVPRTASWSSYQTLVLGQIQLSGGITKFAFVNDSPAPSCFDLLWLGATK